MLKLCPNHLFPLQKKIKSKPILKKTPKRTNSDPQFDFAVGGQAVMEGVMMRSPHYIVIAVRSPKGNILIKEEFYESFATRLGLGNIPILRGMIGLVESMYIGIRSLNFSNSVFLSTETKKTDRELLHETNKNRTEQFFEVLSIILGFGIALLLFKFTPLLLTEQLGKIFTTLTVNHFWYNLTDGFIKSVFFLTYLLLISRLKEVHRLFQYHGAEHKSIMTYETGLPLLTQFAKNSTRFHPRCGTSFIIIVICISILLYTVIPTHESFLLKFLERLIVLPVIAGVAYEVLKYSAKHLDSPLIQVFIQPGLLFQKITTQEPDESQLEVGLASLKKALELEKQLERKRGGKLTKKK